MWLGHEGEGSQQAKAQWGNGGKDSNMGKGVEGE